LHIGENVVEIWVPIRCDIKCGRHRHFETGNNGFARWRCFGYGKGVDCILVIMEGEARVVETIFVLKTINGAIGSASINFNGNNNP